MMRILFAAVVCVWTLAAGAAAGADLRFAKPLTFAAIAADELVAAPLDSDVYAATRDGLPDLRVLADDGSEVSCLVRKAVATRTDTTRSYWAARPPEAEPRVDGGLEIRLRLAADDPPPAGLRFVSPLHNFQHHVRVEASADGQQWRTLVSDGLIFDYAQFMDVRNLDLPLPAGAGGGRYFRLTIDDVTQEQASQLTELTRRITGDQETERAESTTIRRQPFRIDRIEFWHNVAHEHATGDKRIDYPLAGFRVEQDEKRQESHVFVDSRREPLVSLAVEVGDRNFSRRARVEVERVVRGESVWQAIGTAQVEHLDFGTLHRQALAIDFPETRSERYRIAVENRDSPPLAIRAATAEGSVYEVVFLARPGRAYRLAYGSPTLPAANYDTAAIAASLAAKYQPLTAALGEPVALEVSAEPAQPLAARLLADPRVLGAAATLLVIVLAIGLYRASHRVQTLPRE